MQPNQPKQNWFLNYKFLLSVSGIILSVIVAGCISLYKTQKETNQLNSQGNLFSQQKTMDETVNWKTYTNSQYGFSFQYPPSWGEVVLESGNRTDNRCEDEVSSHDFYGPRDGVPIWDVAINFSNLPSLSNTKSRMYGGFKLTKYDTRNHIAYICKKTGDGIDLLKDKQKLLNMPEKATVTDYGLKTIVATINGNKVLYYPDWYGESSINQYYKFYGEKLLVQAGLTFIPSYKSPESGEIKKYCKSIFSQWPCYGDWMRNGQLSAPVRNVFETFHQVLSTFEFTN